MRNPEKDTHAACRRLFIGPNRIEVLPGETFNVQDVPAGPKEIDRMVEAGSARELTVPVSKAAAPPAVPSDPKPGDLEAAQGRIQQPTQAEIEAAHRSRFAMDPDGITGLTLPQLNVMVQERDPTIKPFETIEEAVACLSADYIAPSTELTS